jgi:hypothetical protein
MTKPIRVKNFECWNMSFSVLFGKSPKVKMICGKCDNFFSKRFTSIEFTYNGMPVTRCPECRTKNYVPLTIGR